MWVLISSTSKVSDSWIRDLGFNPRLHQKLIGVLILSSGANAINWNSLLKKNVKQTLNNTKTIAIWKYISVCPIQDLIFVLKFSMNQNKMICPKYLFVLCLLWTNPGLFLISFLGSQRPRSPLWYIAHLYVLVVQTAKQCT